MESNLLGVYESEKAIVRIYTGPAADTPEKRRALLEAAAINFAKAIRKITLKFTRHSGNPLPRMISNDSPIWLYSTLGLIRPKIENQFVILPVFMRGFRFLPPPFPKKFFLCAKIAGVWRFERAKNAEKPPIRRSRANDHTMMLI